MKELDFIADQLYKASCGDGYGVRWSALRDDLQRHWRDEARRVVEDWASDDERFRKARESAWDGIRVEVVK